MSGSRGPLARRLDVSLRAGALLLRNGAETWRVEDTMQRLLGALDVAGSDVVATATSLAASVSDGDEQQTRIWRVRGAALNLSVIDRVNALSRRVGEEGLSLEEAEGVLERIEGSGPLYRLPIRLLGALLGAAGFTPLFGGGAAEVVAVLPGAAALSLAHRALERAHVPSLATVALSALIGTMVAALAARALPGSDAGVVVLSTVVLLVPGAAIVNAIGDLLGGHLLSGLARGAAAALVAAAIAAGVVAGLRLTGVALG